MKTLELSRVAKDGVVVERVSLPVHSGKDPLALLVEAAEDLCLEDAADCRRIAATDLSPFLIPRLDELLDPENHELTNVLIVEGEENVGEHTIRHALKRAVWPTNGSVTLEAAVLCVKLAALAREAAKAAESIEVRVR